MNTARNLVRSSLARVSHSLTVTFVAFFMMPFLVHTLGERWYGIWVVIGNLAGNYYLLDLGLAAAVTQFVSKHAASGDTEAQNVVVNTSLALYLCFAAGIVACTALAAAATAWIPGVEADARIIRMITVVVGLQFAAEFPLKAFAGIFASTVRHDLVVYSRLVNLALNTSLTVYYVNRGHGVLTIAVIAFCCDQISNTLYFVMARRLFPELRLGFRFVSRRAARELFGYSSWALVVQFANQLRFKIDAAVVAGILSAAAVTHYAVAQRLVEHFVGLVNRATNMAMPIFTRYWVLDRRDELREKLLLLTRINAAVGVFGGGMIVVLGGPFISRWMGPEFTSSYPVLVVLTVAMTTELVMCNIDNVLYATSSVRQLATANAVEGLCNLVFSLVLGRRFGIVGVAFGTAVPLLFFRLVVMPRLASRQIGMRPARFYRNLLPTTLFTLGYIIGVGVLSRQWLSVPSYARIVLVGGAALPLYVLVIPFVAFKSSERRYALRVLWRGKPAPLEQPSAREAGHGRA
jgi:O-antigen/teichoic acid export membrane protein